MITLLATALVAYGGLPKASDWQVTGYDCKLYAIGDWNGDGFGDVATINGGRDLCVALSVHGWKSAGWVAVAHDVNPDASALWFEGGAFVVRDGEKQFAFKRDGADDKSSRSEVAASAPPAPPAPASAGCAPAYEPEAKLALEVAGDLNGDGVADRLLVFDCHRPSDQRLLRTLLTPNPRSNDQDSDGLLDSEEAALGTDPFDRDSDGDGLLDGWEVHGLPRGVELGEFTTLYDPKCAPEKRDAQLDPRRRDVLVEVSYFEGVDRKQFRGEMLRVQAVYRALHCANPDGTSGVWVHFKEHPSVIAKAEQALPWWDLGNKYLARKERGLMHWMQVTPWGGGQSSENGDMGGCGNGWAVFSHEFGHQLGLSHSGDSNPAWCPLYPSMMSYAFSYSFDGDGNLVHFSDGSFRDTVLDERHLKERLPYPYAKLKYLANWPFRFTLEDAGDGTTRIDWNHDGKFDEGEVEADINYGGSTYCGVRREHEAVGSAACLAYAGDTCFLVAADQTRDHLWVKTYQGDEKWSEKRDIPASGTALDPVLVGGDEYALVLYQQLYGWNVARVTKAELGTPVRIPDLPALPLNGCRVGKRVLLFLRRDDDSLEYDWLDFTGGDFGKPVIVKGGKLETRSRVVPGCAVDPNDGRVVLVTSQDNAHGAQYCMRASWLAVAGDKLVEQELVWTRGEASGNGCCSRPVVAFNASKQLNIFHQGGPDGNGQMLAYRTSRVGNKKLDEGWLTCLLYDEWTKSRVSVGFASGAQGAVFAYRWDAGGAHVNWLATAHDGFGIDRETMRDFDDGEKIGQWGIRHSILCLNTDGP